MSTARYQYRFSEYYHTLNASDLYLPPRFRSREWMFMGWDDRPPRRHIGFDTPESLRNILTRSSPPHSCFHSTAYYDRPSEYKMAEKGWRGADLIFDLDGDHLVGVDALDFPSMLNDIQEQAFRLWNDFLEPDFGFNAEKATFSFSGHRGFHIHYRHPSILHLDSKARQEIVSHISGANLNIEMVIGNPDLAWGKRVRRGLDSVLNRLQRFHEASDAERRALYRELRSSAVLGTSGMTRPPSMSEKAMLKLSEMSVNSDRRRRLKNSTTNLGRQFGKQGDLFLALILGDQSVVLDQAAENDDNVTVDIRRVIRWIGSLHGKAGLKVTEFPVERLDPDGSNAFDALTEAVTFSKQKRETVCLELDDITARIGDEVVEGNNGDVIEVTEAMAIFLGLKRWASSV
ncbi:MAG TPA: DNA primase small subunit domain-containing protein [Candidatus Thalassarchaeaceae archaeon]|nr:DNA primase small subunit domain-containing protein [Candidatus Thalassarchaeaceae archaeon]